MKTHNFNVVQIFQFYIHEATPKENNPLRNNMIQTLINLYKLKNLSLLLSLCWIFLENLILLDSLIFLCC